MEIKEIEGKKYVEYDEDKANNKRFVISLIFLFLMVIAILAMIAATATILKNKDLIGKDPILYGMDKHNFDSCQCSDNKGVLWYSTDEGFTTQLKQGGDLFGAG